MFVLSQKVDMKWWHNCEQELCPEEDKIHSSWLMIDYDILVPNKSWDPELPIGWFPYITKNFIQTSTFQESFNTV